MNFNNRSKSSKLSNQENTNSRKLTSQELNSYNIVEQEKHELDMKKQFEKSLQKEDSFMNKSINSEYRKNISNSNMSTIRKNGEISNSMLDTQIKIKKLFEYYCQFGERLNIKLMKICKFYKLLIDCKLIDDILNKTRIELIFSSENKHKQQMYFETFLNTLIKVAEVKYSSLPSNQALQTLIREYILPRYEQIFGIQSNSKSVQINNNINSGSNANIDLRNSIIICNNEFNFDNDTEELLTSIAPLMFDIYKVYFPFELSLAENMNFILENSQKHYFIFLKDFDVCPTIISKSTCFHIFQTEVNNHLEITENYLNIIQNLDFISIKKFSTKNILGQYFNFFKFLRSLMRIAELSFDKLETNVTRKLSLYEKLCLCLERMELSEGFLNIQQKTSNTFNEKTSFLVPREIAERIKANIFDNKDGETAIDQIDGSITTTQPMKTFNRLRKSIIGIVERPQYEYYDYIVEKYGNELLNIFKFYCSFGDPLNTQYLTNVKWTKFLREARLIKSHNKFDGNKTNNSNAENNNDYGISYTDIDRHYFKVTNKAEKPRESIQINSTTISLKGNEPKNKIVNSNSKIDFNTFINLVEYSCGIIFPNKDLKESIDFIITNHILPLGKNNSNKLISSHINFLMEKQTKPDLVEILVLVHKAFLPIYKHYSNRYTFLMNFDNFLNFCRDFSIFPDIVPKSKLNAFFKSISACMSLSEQQDGTEFVDDNYFVDLLALCAFEVSYRDPQPSPVEKILLFMDKLSQSEGTDKIVLRSGSTRLSSGDNLDILSHFRSHYPDYFTIKIVKKPNFSDLLSDDS